MNNVINYCDWKRIPPDLWPRIFEAISKEKEAEIVKRSVPPQIYLGTAIYLGKGFQGRRVLVTTSPTLIIPAGPAYPYMILNPSRTVGLTSSGVLYSGTVNAAGNTQSSPLGVANYLNMHLFLDVTAVSGTWDFVAQARDPESGNWADSQVIFSGITTTGTRYASIGQLGVATDFAVRWEPTAAGSITFSLSYSLKEGIIGSAAGLSQTVFIGSNNGITVTSGFPILEGNKEVFIVGENVEVWAIAYVSLYVNIFQL